MSKAERMREQQQKINQLEEEVRQLKGQLFQYRKRDRPQAGDNIVVKHR